MKTRKMGSLMVSEIGMGCMPFSHGHGDPPPRQQSIRLMRLAHELGVTLYDTADAYADGHNEILVGEALKPIRHEVCLSTKYNPELHPVTDPTKGTVKEQIESRLDASLKRLGTDYIDLYYAHRITDDVPLEDVAGYMGDFIKKGKIRAWGMSRVTAEQIRIANAVTPVAAIQNEYSMLERSPEKDGVLDTCKELGIGLVPYMPLAAGFLTGTIKPGQVYKNDDAKRFSKRFSDEAIQKNQPLLEILDKMSKKKNCSYAQMAIAWLMHMGDNIVPIPGMMSEPIIRENLDIAKIQLTPEEMAEINASIDKCDLYTEWDEECIGKLKEALKKEGYEPGMKSWGHD